jgi:hypothetical protein
MEHINKAIQDDIDAHKNSTHDWTTILRSYARLAPYYGKLRKAMGNAVEYKNNGKHSARSVVFDVFVMAMQMWKEGYVHWTNSKSADQFLCSYVAEDGAELLPAAIEAFNRDVVDKQAGAQPGQAEGIFTVPNGENKYGHDADDDEDEYSPQETDEQVFATFEPLDLDK